MLYDNLQGTVLSFNPCFNGSMYKNIFRIRRSLTQTHVSILVLMDLCIKTVGTIIFRFRNGHVSILVLMDLCIKTNTKKLMGGRLIGVSILVLMDLCIKT